MPRRSASSSSSSKSSFAATVAAITAGRGFAPTVQQEAIYAAVAATRGPGVAVSAVAGSGKTTTIVDAARFVPAAKRALFVAFNRKIVDELGARLPTGFPALTLHQLGFGFIRAALPRVRVEQRKLSWMYRDAPDWARPYYGAVRRLVGLAKNLGLFSPTAAQVGEIADRYDIDIDADARERVFALAADFVRDSLARTDIIDFDDMLVLAVARGWVRPDYDIIIVDEAQDLNPVQLALLRGAMRPHGRVVAVGDPAQAIYGFRGAMTDSFARVVAEFGLREYPLSVCWRCGSAIVASAREYCPLIEAAPGAAPGEVVTIKRADYAAQVRDGDFVLCRMTAPLVRECLRFVRGGRKAVVLGRHDIGDSLIELSRVIERATTKSVDSVMARCEAWREAQLRRIGSADDDGLKAASLNDRVDTLIAVAEYADGATFDAVRARIETIFSESAAGITLSTVHRAKGLETDRVFIVHPEKLPHPRAKTPEQIQQERNLAYVARTRARKYLAFVHED